MQFVSAAQCVWLGQDGVSAPETRAGRMATICEGDSRTGIMGQRGGKLSPQPLKAT